MSTAVVAASQGQRATVPNVPTMSVDIPYANWICWTAPDQLHHSDSTKRRLSAHLNLAYHAVNKHRPPSRITTTIFLLLLLLLLHCLTVCRCGACYAHQHYIQS
nr:unnamed protein product [Spirometra erinaceieuropaei]